MRVGMIGEKEIVSIKSYDSTRHIVRFVNWQDKLKMPEDFRDAPWGYDAFRVFLPEDVIEGYMSRCFPGIKFVGRNGEEEEA
jgi:hypothetical protein